LDSGTDRSRCHCNFIKAPPLASPWQQNYDPTGHWWLSTLIAALPIVVLLGTLALLHIKAHYAALLGLARAWRQRYLSSTCRHG
jgi:hypothetical protein